MINKIKKFFCGKEKDPIEKDTITQKQTINTKGENPNIDDLFELQARIDRILTERAKNNGVYFKYTHKYSKDHYRYGVGKVNELITKIDRDVEVKGITVYYNDNLPESFSELKYIFFRDTLDKDVIINEIDKDTYLKELDILLGIIKTTLSGNE